MIMQHLLHLQMTRSGGVFIFDRDSEVPPIIPAALLCEVQQVLGVVNIGLTTMNLVDSVGPGVMQRAPESIVSH